MKVAQHTIQIDGIDYELTVRDENPGYFGAWFCCKCWLGGVKYDLLPIIGDAMAQAESGASLHHENNHASK